MTRPRSARTAQSVHPFGWVVSAVVLVSATLTVRPDSGQAPALHPGLRTTAFSSIVNSGGARSEVGESLPLHGPCRDATREVHHIDGPLHVCGDGLVDAGGHSVRPLAIEVSMALQCGAWAPPPAYAAADIGRWGFNAVELYVSWANLEPSPPTPTPSGGLVHHWDRTYLSALDAAVQQFSAHGLAVILAMHQSRWSPAFTDLTTPTGYQMRCGIGMPAWLYPQGGGLEAMVRAERRFFQNRHGVQAGLVAAWRMVAGRYAGNPTVVGAVLLNEAYDLLAQDYPGTAGLTARSLHLDRFYDRMGRAVHQANSDLVVFFGQHLSTRTKLFAAPRAPRLPYAVMATEFYAPNWEPNGHRRIEEYHRLAQAWNVPLWIGEFSAFNYTTSRLGVDPHWVTDTRALLRYARHERIGWAICCYGSGGFQVLGEPRQAKPRLVSVLRSGF